MKIQNDLGTLKECFKLRFLVNSFIDNNYLYCRNVNIIAVVSLCDILNDIVSNLLYKGDSWKMWEAVSNAKSLFSKEADKTNFFEWYNKGVLKF